MACHIAQEEDLHNRHREIVSQRTTLTAAARKQEELEEDLMMIPDDEQGLERNDEIRQQINLTSCLQKRLDAQNPQLKRHSQLKMEYNVMVKKERDQWMKNFKT